MRPASVGAMTPAASTTNTTQAKITPSAISDKQEFRAPTEKVVDRSAEQWRKSWRRRGSDHDERHHACERLSVEQVAGDRACEHTGGTGTTRLNDAAGEQVRKVGSRSAPDR